MLTTLRAFALSAALLAGPALAECTSTLDVTVTGDLSTGGSISADLSGSLPNAMTFLLVGTQLGSTTIQLPSGTLELGLAQPFAALPLGPTDGGGNASLSINYPAVPVQIDPITVHVQAVSVGLVFGGGPPSLDTCVSNVETIAIQ